MRKDKWLMLTYMYCVWTLNWWQILVTPVTVPSSSGPQQDNIYSGCRSEVSHILKASQWRPGLPTDSIYRNTWERKQFFSTLHPPVQILPSPTILLTSFWTCTPVLFAIAHSVLVCFVFGHCHIYSLHASPFHTYAVCPFFWHFWQLLTELSVHLKGCSIFCGLWHGERYKLVQLCGSLE